MFQFHVLENFGMRFWEVQSGLSSISSTVIALVFHFIPGLQHHWEVIQFSPESLHQVSDESQNDPSSKRQAMGVFSPLSSKGWNKPFIISRTKSSRQWLGNFLFRIMIILMKANIDPKLTNGFYKIKSSLLIIKAMYSGASQMCWQSLRNASNSLLSSRVVPHWWAWSGLPRFKYIQKKVLLSGPVNESASTSTEFVVLVSWVNAKTVQKLLFEIGTNGNWKPSME